MKGFPTFAPHWLLLGSLFPTLRTLSSGFSPLNASFFDRVLSSDRTEVLGIQWAIDELPGLAEKYGSEAEFQIKLVTQYVPCNACARGFNSGTFVDFMDQAAGKNVSFELWHYPDPQGGAQPPPNLWGAW